MATIYSSGADTYSEMSKDAFPGLNRQVGITKPAAVGIMYKGLMICHLLMPNNVSGTYEVITWIVANLPIDTYFNLMS